MHLSLEKSFTLRAVPLGDHQSLKVEVAFVKNGGEVWLVLRELPTRGPRLLPLYFEFVASFVRFEWVYLRQQPAPSRHFECAYGMRPGAAVVEWQFKEVCLSPDASTLQSKLWERVPLPLQTALSATLQLSELPSRTFL